MGNYKLLLDHNFLVRKEGLNQKLVLLQFILTQNACIKFKNYETGVSIFVLKTPKPSQHNGEYKKHIKEKNIRARWRQDKPTGTIYFHSVNGSRKIVKSLPVVFGF